MYVIQYVIRSIFSITKSARGRPRKGEVKEERYKRKKDRHRKPLVQIKLDENLFQQHKVLCGLQQRLSTLIILLPVFGVFHWSFKDGKRTLILCTKKLANAATAYYQRINQPTTLYPCKIKIIALILCSLYNTQFSQFC